MKASQALNLIQYLVKEKDFLPWKVALAQLQFVMVHIQVIIQLITTYFVTTITCHRHQ